MLEKRYIAGLVLLISFFTLATSASAEPILTLIPVSPLNVTVGVNPGGAANTQVDLVFNFTNATATSGGLDFGDLNLTNLTVSLEMTNGTQVLLYNDTTSVINYINDSDIFMFSATPTIFINATDFPPDQEGTLLLNITVEMYNATDIAPASWTLNSSETFFGFVLGLDITSPGITIKFYDKNEDEKTTFPATDPVKIVCTRSASGASFNNTNISIQTPLSNTFDTLETDTARGTSASEFKVTFTQTRDLGDYVVACYSIDDLGSINDTVNATFTVLKKPPRGSSAFVNSEFKPPVATILVSDGTVSSIDPFTEEGSSRLMAKGGAISFTQGAQAYTLTLKEYTDTSATYTVAGGTSFDVAVNTQETKPADVDGDGKDDVSITLHQVYNKRADTTFKMILVQQASQPQEETKEETKEPTTTTQEVSTSSGWGLIVFIFLVVLFILGALHFLSARRRGGNVSPANSSSVRFTPKDLGLQRPPSEPGTFTRY